MYRNLVSMKTTRNAQRARAMAMILVMTITVAWATAGCVTEPEPRPEIVLIERTKSRAAALPAWVTNPPAGERGFVPLKVGMRGPPPIEKLARDHQVPAWIAYGVVRTVGAERMLVHGTKKVYRRSGGRTRDDVVIDEITYDVPYDRVVDLLDRIRADTSAGAGASAAVEGEDPFDRYVLRREGDLVLFGMERPGEDAALRPDLPPDPGGFDEPAMADVVKHGVRFTEGPDRYTLTLIGGLEEGRVFESLVQTEEEAILELCQSIMVTIASLDKDAGIVTARAKDREREEIYRTSVSVEVRGLVVTRRRVDFVRKECMVSIEVPRQDVIPR